MNTIGVLLLAAATASSGIGKPHVGAKRWLRPHATMHGAPPASGPVDMAALTGSVASGMDLAAGAGRRFPNVRSQLYFVEPVGMQIGWQTAAGTGERVYLPAQLVAPARYNFLQGYIYRLKLSNIPGREGMNLYPTLEVAPSTPATDAYLTHNPIPVQFTEEDFDQVQAGNFVTKVIYLPDPRYQELAVAGVETLVSTRLEPGIDPVLEADRRGTILLIIRLGGIDLEMPSSGSGTIATSPIVDESIPSQPPAPPASLMLPSAPVDSPPVNPAPTLPQPPAPDLAQPPAPPAPDPGF
ncbi:MAG: hypothetical protein KatS3mg108_1126 [Isosphaeraceae bacterium]|jgi:hypothetical protein|nr:MAG: hypothetical protein KatS3mg108_1126 [Isosphaeraceae bacterium]